MKWYFAIRYSIEFHSFLHFLFFDTMSKADPDSESEYESEESCDDFQRHIQLEELFLTLYHQCLWPPAESTDMSLAEIQNRLWAYVVVNGTDGYAPECCFVPITPESLLKLNERHEAALSIDTSYHRIETEENEAWADYRLLKDCLPPCRSGNLPLTDAVKARVSPSYHIQIH